MSPKDIRIPMRQGPKPSQRSPKEVIQTKLKDNKTSISYSGNDMVKGIYLRERDLAKPSKNLLRRQKQT